MNESTETGRGLTGDGDRFLRAQTPFSRQTTVMVSVNDLRIALAAGHIAPHYQPVVSTADGSTVAVEALARWNHPGFGVIGPNYFVPLAVKNGLIGDLTEAVMGAVIGDCQALSLRPGKSGADIKMSVNLNANAVTQSDFVEIFAVLMAANALECKDLVLEFSAEEVMQASDALVAALTRLGELGFGMCVDEFPLDPTLMDQVSQGSYGELKIDQAQFPGHPRQRSHNADAEACLAHARQLDLCITAKRIETEKQWDFACRSGIDRVQGVYIAPPMPFDDLLGWIAQQTPANSLAV